MCKEAQKSSVISAPVRGRRASAPYCRLWAARGGGGGGGGALLTRPLRVALSGRLRRPLTADSVVYYNFQFYITKLIRYNYLI
ncbi:hypothetical protein EVAR_25592_1 [Eumeta japonica]|uniref:Uncharacterized protein n=1 Tax=Eumeta variegata TaxID=151549 RepID=A0A4C1V0P4_EUMVA|nr:hypothetical protein EVAR_25592_1 [Eumeta japonica]